MNTNTNISFRERGGRYCSASWPPSERVQRAGYWSLRVACYREREVRDVKTDGSAAGFDQRIIKVW
jgi:hypothetical protein